MYGAAFLPVANQRWLVVKRNAKCNAKHGRSQHLIARTQIGSRHLSRSATYREGDKLYEYA